MKLSYLNSINENINLDEYINLREKVKSNMNYPEWLGDFTKEDLEFLLNNGSKIWLYYFENKPVCSMMLIPSDEKDLLKFEMPLNYQEVVDYGPMFVHPEFVGNGLQFQMLEKLDKYCMDLGYKYAITTVHPDNIYSIRNLLKDGFEYKNTKEFKRGTRNVYLKKY